MLFQRVRYWKMEETKENETRSGSETSVPEVSVEEPVTKKQKRVLSDKQKAILSLGREKAKLNREAKMKAKLDGMVEEYLKDKSEESVETKKKPKKSVKKPKSPPPPPPPASEPSSSESEEDDDDDEEEEEKEEFPSSEESSDYVEEPPIKNPVLRRTKKGPYYRPRSRAIDLHYT